MGFLLYNRSGQKEAMRYTLVRKLSIVGPNGALSLWLKAHSGESLPFEWKLYGEKLVRALAPDADPATHTIVMDMMPERLAGASLCHVTSLAGKSDSDSTDIVIAMRELYMAQTPVCGIDPRLAFICDLTASAPDLIESMGVAGGTKLGTYKWCAPKMNIGAAVFQKARAGR